MARIVDPDGLNLNTEVSFDTTSRLIELHVGVGNLTQEGVTLQALYSACKEFWQTDADLIKIPFPFEAITEVKFDIINGWDFNPDDLKADGDKTNQLIRDGGWSKMGAGGVPKEQYFGFVTLGLMSDPLSDQAYFIQETAGAVSDTIYLGQVNEPVKIYGDIDHGNIDYRSVFEAFLREQATTYAKATLADQNVFSIDYSVYKLPLANAPDPKVVASDNDIETLPRYAGMKISYLRGNGFIDWVSEGNYAIDDVVRDTTVAPARWFRSLTAHSGVVTAPSADATNWEAYLGERQIGDNWYAYNIVVDADSQLAEYVYEFTQYKNRQGVDINDDMYTEGFGSVVGQIAPQLLSFLGDTLITGSGVFVENFDTSDTNRIEFSDADGTRRLYPFVAAGRINFNDNLQADTAAKYWMFFADGFGTTSAILVNDADGVPIAGDILGAAFKNFSFDYDGNTQGGRLAGTDASVVVVGLGLDRAQYVSVEGTISREVGLVFTLVSALERNYISGP